MNVQSSLARHAHMMREPDAADGWELARDAWHTHGIAMFNLTELERRQGWSAARQARNLAEQAFGKRRGAQNAKG
jgi:hypothetical protein